MNDYKLMNLINNIYNRVKYGTIEREEKEDLYNDLRRFADGDFNEVQDE